MVGQPHREDSGAVMVLGAMALVGLLAFAGLVIDVGNLYYVRRDLQKTADAAALAAVLELPSGTAARAEAIEYGNLNHPIGIPVQGSDVEIGRWDATSRTFSPDGSPANAVRVTARRDAFSGSPVDLVFLPVVGIETAEVSAVAIALRVGTGTRFLIDDEMFDTDVPAIEELAAQEGMTTEALLSDGNGNWWVDICEVAPGTRLELPTGQVGDEGLFDIDVGGFPFGTTTSPSHLDFLNFNEDGSWRQSLIPKSMLDPLVGVARVNSASDYPGYVDPTFIHVSPLYRSDVSALNPVGGVPAVSALGLRRGLVAFRVVGVGADPDGPSGSVLPNLIIELVHPSAVNLALVTPGGGGSAVLVG